MSLLQLLTVNRGIQDVRNEPTPYKMSAKVALPKFAPANRPIALTPAREEMVIAVVPGSLFEVRQPSADAAAKATDPAPAHGESLLAGESAAPEWGAVALSAAAKRPTPVGRWALARNPAAEAIPAAPRPAPAQGQLTLDSVIPVRNDLSDADLEVVKAATGTGAEPSQGGRVAAAKGSRWSRVVGWLFPFRKAQV